MALKVTKADVWAATIEDRAGGTAEKLEGLSKAGANLEMLLARRTAEQPGKGVMFVTPLKGKAVKAAQDLVCGATLLLVQSRAKKTSGSLRPWGQSWFLTMSRLSPQAK